MPTTDDSHVTIRSTHLTFSLTTESQHDGGLTPPYEVTVALGGTRIGTFGPFSTRYRADAEMQVESALADALTPFITEALAKCGIGEVPS